jgi:hypothetical protein
VVLPTLGNIKPIRLINIHKLYLRSYLGNARKFAEIEELSQLRLLLENLFLKESVLVISVVVYLPLKDTRKKVE